MLPLNLKMESFGSYAEPTEIDFTKLGSQGVFLVSGKMGAGKTIIFDAILYALFGCVTGDKRDHLCCTHTAPKVVTKVEFTFSYKGREYCVFRTRKKKKDGDESNENAELKLVDGETVAKSIKDVNAYVKNLFGLDEDKFKGISILAQGKFKEILLASSEERRVMFRDLFHTALFNDIQNKISYDKSIADSKVKSCENVLANQLQNIVATDNLSLTLQNQWTELNRMDLLVQLPQVLGWLEQVLQTEAALLADNKTEQSKLTDEKDNLKQLLTDLEKYLKQEELWAQAVAKEKEGKKAKEQAKVNKETATKAVEEVPNLEKLNAAIQTNIDNFASLEKASKEIKAKEKDKAHKSEDIAKKQKRSTELGEKIATAEVEVLELPRIVESLTAKTTDLTNLSTINKNICDLGKMLTDTQRKQNSCVENVVKLEQDKVKAEADLKQAKEKEQAIIKAKLALVEVNAALVELQALQNDVKECKNRLATWEKSCAEADKYTKQLKSATEAVNNAIKKATEAELLYNNTQAGFLARGLEEGVPCPVCGSIHHPCLAQMPTDTPSKEEVETFKQKADAARERLGKVQSEKAAVEGKRDVAWHELKVKVLAVVGSEDSSKLAQLLEVKDAEISEQSNAKTKERKELQAIVDEAEQNQNDLQKYQLAVDNLINWLQAENMKKAQLEIKEEDCLTSITELRAKALAEVPVLTVDTRLGLLEQLRSIYGQISKEVQKCTAEINTLTADKDNLQKLQDMLPSYRTQRDNLAKEIQELQNALTALETELKPLYVSQDELNAQLKGLTLEEEKQKLQDNTDKISALNANLDQATSELQKAEVALGKLEGTRSTLEKNLTAMTVAANKAEALAKQQEKKAAQDSLLAKLDKLQTVAEQLNNERIRNNNVYDNLAQYNEEYIAANKRLTFLNTLESTFNSRSGIKLEAFVQMRYFERVLRRANQRLLKMTDGRYELLRDTREKGNGAKGLGIMVVDHYDSSRRSISDFSGGEGFLASLSLALGLSDEIQSSNGGIRLDSVFVDEGFGTLDPYTLGVTMNVLKDLANNDILVGIISHVKELEDNIPKQIVVEKTIVGEIESSHAKVCIKD